MRRGSLVSTSPDVYFMLAAASSTAAALTPTSLLPRVFRDIKQPSHLLQLPDTCLLLVLQCCAADHRSLCSAARAHSRLHKAAVVALSSITGELKDEQVDSMLLYLKKFGQHVSSIDLEGVRSDDQQSWDMVTVTIRQTLAPHNNQHNSNLERLNLTRLHLQLQPGWGLLGLFGAGPPPLKQLRLQHCTLLDGGAGLAAALWQLPELQHLCVMPTMMEDEKAPYGRAMEFPCYALPALQHLTYLEIAGCALLDPNGLQPLQGLTCLQDLRLSLFYKHNNKASMLIASQQLTRLELCGQLLGMDGRSAMLDPRALAGQTRLQHLVLKECILLLGAGMSDLLSHVQQLQQLTHLSFTCSSDVIPIAGYSALTASSKLQHLDISSCTFPAGVWQHVFPAGRQLSHLRALYISGGCLSSGPAAVPEGHRLVSAVLGCRHCICGMFGAPRSYWPHSRG